MIWIYSLTQHKDIKSKCLSLIEKSVGESIDSVDKIAKTDYFLKYDEDVESFDYFKILHSVLGNSKFYDKVLEIYLINEIKISRVWYQQYFQGNTHGWHIHPESNISAVYCLELENSSDSTEFIDYQNNNIISTNAKEGDIIVFPSYIMHRAPVVKSNTRKTTINFNIDLGPSNPNLIKNFLNYE